METTDVAPPLVPTVVSCQSCSSTGDKIRRTRVLIVSGLTGNGKTSFINLLLRRKPRTNSWGVLQNDFGQTHVDKSSDDGVVLDQLLGGCACCTIVPVRTALTRLLRRPKPSLVIVELSTLGLPLVLAQLLWANYANVVETGPTVMLVQTAKHTVSWEGSEWYRQQLEQADLLLMLGGSDEEQAQISTWVSESFPLKRVVGLPPLTELLNSAQMTSEIEALLDELVGKPSATIDSET